MSQMKQLKQLIDELEQKAKATIELGNSQLTILTEIRQLFSNEPETLAKPSPATKVTKEEVRKVLAEKAGQGFKAEVKALLTAYGATSLSTLGEEHYVSVLEEAGGIGND